MEFDGIPIQYLNASLISVAEHYGISHDRRDISYRTDYQLLIYNHNSFAEIIKDIDTLTRAIYQGATIYVPSNYQLLFGKACEAIASKTNINAYAICEIVKKDAEANYQRDLIEFQAKKNKERQRAITEAERREQLEEFLIKVDRNMAELVRELRITVSKAYKPFAIIGVIVGLGYGSWLATQYWINEKSAQGKLVNIRNQNLMLKTENEELAVYKNVKSKIQNLNQQIEVLKGDINKIKVENNSLNQEITKVSEENSNLRNRIEKCNSRFLGLRKC
jgi:FtsZ-binding cell division protein ZapB